MAGSAGALHFQNVLQACAFFNVDPPAGASPAMTVLLSLSAEGSKLGETNWRPYYIVVCGSAAAPASERVVLLGKLMETLVSSHYRGSIIRASECETRADAVDGLLLHLLRARAPPGEKAFHVVLRARSAGERNGMFERLRGVLVAPQTAQNLTNLPSGAPSAATIAAGPDAVPPEAAKLRPHVARILPKHPPFGGGVAHAAATETTGPPESGAVSSLEVSLRALEERVRMRSAARGPVPSTSGAPESPARRVAVDALPSMPPRSVAFGPDDADAKHRYAVYAELLETELAYVRSLQVLVDEIMGPLHKSGGPKGVPELSSDPGARAPRIIDPALIPGIFGIAETLAEVNAAFVEELATAFAGGGRLSESVTKCFQRILPFFRMYADYAKGFSQRLEVLNSEVAANERFAAYLYFCQLKPQSGGLDLPSFLIKPIQRLCRYPLLLSEVVKHMPADHPMRSAMIATRDGVERVAHEVNSRMAAADQRDKLCAVWRMLDETVPDLFLPHRTLVLDVHSTEVVLMTQNAGASILTGAKRELHVADARLFLLSDILLVCQRVHSVFRVSPASTPAPTVASTPRASTAAFASSSESVGMSLPGDADLLGLKEGWRYRLIKLIPLADAHLAAECAIELAAMTAAPPRGGLGVAELPSDGAIAPVSLTWSTTSDDGAAGAALVDPAQDTPAPKTAVARLGVTCPSEAVRCALLRALADTVRRAQGTQRDGRRRELLIRQQRNAEDRPRLWVEFAAGRGGGGTGGDGPDGSSEEVGGVSGAGGTEAAAGTAATGAGGSGRQVGRASDAIRQLDAIRQRQQDRVASVAGQRVSVGRRESTGT